MVCLEWPNRVFQLLLEPRECAGWPQAWGAHCLPLSPKAPRVGGGQTLHGGGVWHVVGDMGAEFGA